MISVKDMVWEQKRAGPEVYAQVFKVYAQVNREVTFWDEVWGQVCNQVRVQIMVLAYHEVWRNGK